MKLLLGELRCKALYQVLFLWRFSVVQAIVALASWVTATKNCCFPFKFKRLLQLLNWSHFPHQLTCKTLCFKGVMLSHASVLHLGEQHEEEAACGSFTHCWGSLISCFVALFPWTTQNSRCQRRIAWAYMGAFFSPLQLLLADFQLFIQQVPGP